MSDQTHTVPQILRAILILGGLACGSAVEPPVGNSASSYPGFTLYSVFGSDETILIDGDNAEVHTWSHDRIGGYSVYLLPNGNVIRPALSSGSPLNGGGAAGLVQIWNPNSVRVWQYQYASNTVRSHHDICPMPNGNVLLIAWELKTAAQAVQAGLDYSAEIWPDHIIEVDPVGSSGGNIVWEWHVWDHLIQDHDPTKDNYGVIADHPELIDLNLGGGGVGSGDWMHVNGISYNAVWDQIVFSSHTLNEIYVIDHSTTTAEAASHTGGNYGRGGDILYRWGNPDNYGAAGPEYFHVVHCPSWIPQGYPGGGHLLAFNNREGQGTSMVVEWIPPAAYGHYPPPPPGTAFGPPAPNWTYTAAGFYSNHLGGCQRLANGNTLIAESTSGNLFEVSSSGATQWSYTPGGQIARALRYGMSDPGIIALGLASGVEPAPEGPPQLRLAQNSPNPFRESTVIGYELANEGRVTLTVYDVLGTAVATLVDGPVPAGSGSVEFDASALGRGTYFYRLAAGGRSETKKLVVHE